jgi:hypothetical protein
MRCRASHLSLASRCQIRAVASAVRRTACVVTDERLAPRFAKWGWAQEREGPQNGNIILYSAHAKMLSRSPRPRPDSDARDEAVVRRAPRGAHWERAPILRRDLDFESHRSGVRRADLDSLQASTREIVAPETRKSAGFLAGALHAV